MAETPRGEAEAQKQGPQSASYTGGPAETEPKLTGKRRTVGQASQCGPPSELPGVRYGVDLVDTAWLSTGEDTDLR